MFLTVEESTKNIVKTAAIAVGSLKETEFDIRFNPDVYSPGIRHSENLDAPLPKQRQLVKDAAEFLLTVQIPTFVRFDFLTGNRHQIKTRLGFRFETVWTTLPPQWTGLRCRRRCTTAA